MSGNLLGLNNIPDIIERVVVNIFFIVIFFSTKVTWIIPFLVLYNIVAIWYDRRTWNKGGGFYGLG